MIYLKVTAVVGESYAIMRVAECEHLFVDLHKQLIKRD
jgi:hypothetical protein